MIRVDPRSGTVLVWGAVQAGQAANTVPQEGLVRGTRTGDRGVWADLEPLIRELVTALLAPTGVGFDLRHVRGVPPVVNEPASTGLLCEGVAAALGQDALTGTAQSSGGEDCAWYLEHVPDPSAASVSGRVKARSTTCTSSPSTSTSARWPSGCASWLTPPWPPWPDPRPR